MIMYGLITVGVIKRKLSAQDTDIKMSYMPDKKMMKAEPNGLESIGIVPIPSKDVGAVWPAPEIGGKKAILIETDGDRSKEIIEMMLSRGLEVDPPPLINPTALSCGDDFDLYSLSAYSCKPMFANPDIRGHSHEFDEEMKRVLREMPAAFGMPPELLYGDKAGEIMNTESSVNERNIKIAKLKSYGVDYDVSGFTNAKLDLALKVIKGYKDGARCGCGARAEYFTEKGFVCFEHAGLSTSSASPGAPLSIPEIIGGPKNRAERRKQKRKTWKGR
jgi:hypothetical protein